MLRDGSYKQAAELKATDSLMPLLESENDQLSKPCINAFRGK